MQSDTNTERVNFSGNYVVIDPKGQAHVLDPAIWGLDHVTGFTVRATVERHARGDDFSSPVKVTCCGKQVRRTWRTFGLIDSYDEVQYYGEDISSVCSKIAR